MTTVLEWLLTKSNTLFQNCHPHLSPVPEGLSEKNIWYTDVINDITWNKKYFQKDVFSCFEESSKKTDAKQWLRALGIHESIIIFSGTIPRNHFKRMYVSFIVTKLILDVNNGHPFYL